MTLQQSLKKKRYLLHKIYEHYRFVKPYMARNKKGGHTNTVTNISIFSEPRGGSTWMASLLTRLPQSVLVFEPMFLIPAYREIKPVQFVFNQYIPEEAAWPEATEYFRKLYHQEIDSFSSLRLYYSNKSLRDIRNSRYFIYKDVNSNMLLPWLTRQFDINPIYLLRHPCAVISSQLKYRHWDYIQQDLRAYFPDPKDRHQELFEQYKDVIGKISKPEERLAAEWALHNVVPLKHPENNRRWITVSYEKLYNEPETELENIFSRLGVDMPAEIYSAIRKPSFTTINSSKSLIEQGGQLAAWKQSLTTAQVRNILQIVREFGIDIYDESPEPDYSRIYV
ncbi:Sulfotransferase family protein [Chitinophaga eiseniae]|uniref:Sulfotransferase family protein n=1 Tax=Chitinophaga eiseniae TaxID=634771 RepID=A0A1T4U7F2_9BACT|nr:sulfotransferase [Chitinophaga eiseniae]SKA48607.1 Sulfotransferase family protein [Chitinophaga eiseniae]